MSDPVKLNITKIGLESALNADINGVEVKLAKIKFSTNRFASVSNDPRTTLTNIVHESAISAGGTSIEQNTLRLVSIVDSPSEYDIGSLGVYTEDGVLFAIASVETGSLMKILPRISFTMSFGMTLTPTLLERIVIAIDPETAYAVAMMFQHENHTNPHPQYLQKIASLEEAINNIVTNIDNYQDIRVGDLYITTVDFVDSNAVKAHKGYGTWERYGDGHSLVAASKTSNEAAPNFMRTIGSTGGEYKHKLTTDELPTFNLKVSQNLSNWYKDNNPKNEGDVLINYIDKAMNNVETSSIGSDTPHNIVQPSIVVGVWKRTA